jgi:hypothetical protein
MNYDNFYKMGETGASRPYRGKFEPYELAFPLSRGEANSDRPIRITWKMGGAIPGNVIRTTSAHPMIVHARVLDIFEKHGFTGWSSYSVTVFDKSGRETPDYAGLTITGRCARGDLSQSQIVLRRYAGGWIPHFLGHYFPPNSWDGSDLFMELPDSLGKLSSIRIITARVKEALVRAKISNIKLTPLPDDCRLCDIYTIGLKHLLPKDFNKRVGAAYKNTGVPRLKHVVSVKLEP